MKKLLIIVAGIALLMTGCNEVKDRDGNVYKTVKIGNQVWMAQNLNVQTEESWCYDDNPANCEKYGRLYTWSAAKNACPEGWHLPSKEEFEVLINWVGGEKIAGRKLKSRSGWGSSDSDNGTDDLGFSVLPAGAKGYNGGDYCCEGHYASFWNYTERNDSNDPLMRFSYAKDHAYIMRFFNDKDLAYQTYDYKGWGYSVRCVKD